MALKTWLGTTNDTLDTATNWSGSANPVTTDSWLYNEQSSNNAITNAATAFPTFTVPKLTGAPRFTKRVGSPSAYLTLATINDLYWQSAGDQAYINATTSLDRATVDMRSNSDTGLVLKGILKQITILRGKVTIDGAG